MSRMLATFRRLQTHLAVVGKGRYLSYGKDLHVGRGSRLWAPHRIVIGSNVYIGKEVHIEANCEIGDFCLLANRVAIVGRHDHDFEMVGFPMRYAPWVGSLRFPSPYLEERAVIETDVWLGFATIVLTGVKIGKGSVVAAGSIVTKDIPPYSIAAGVPAIVVGQRFANSDAITTHENSLRAGEFRFSERGYDYCKIEPSLN